MKKVLIVGSSGLLGRHLKIYLENKFNITCFVRRKKSDIFNKINLSKYFKNNKFDIIIYLAAITSIDRCEKFKLEAYKVNFKNLKNLYFASFDKERNPLYIFLSTDQFYNSFKSNTERKKKIFNYYAKTKLLSENFLESKNSIILRTNFLGKSITKDRKSFSDFIYYNLKSKKKIYLANDILFSPLAIKTLCKIICLCCKKKIRGKFNVGSKNGFSKYRFGIDFAKRLDLNLKLINKVNYNDLNFKTKRPKDMRMKLNYFERKYNFKLPHLTSQLAIVCNEY